MRKSLSFVAGGRHGVLVIVNGVVAGSGDGSLVVVEDLESIALCRYGGSSLMETRILKRRR